ncbi:AraC family transcriptional regulator [Parablautia sp. Marseille-Q6255]|uniref:AraC family transcriptional regulator n=1 Tax=Parablautia sp. Marseille-Q6255 TaxID=3039593 RepID=UPI0024BD2310|nr:AraC family transcriptional regulator [Parablautia sp. Marseille-Q6255]
MSSDTSYSRIITDENLMETIQHGRVDYPFHFYYDNLGLFDFNCIEWHWHAELEFVYIESGTVTFWIGEKQFTLPEGHGVFINSKILHRFSSSDRAVVPNFLCLPFFIAAQDSLIYNKYVLPFITSSMPFRIFHTEVSWEAEALSIIKQIIAVQSCASCELATSALIQRLWLTLYEHTDIPKQERTNVSAASQARLQMMMQYIHQNYAANISLDDIARHAMISKSTVLNLFNKYLRITPINYLINYRLKEAALLLSKTEEKISAIARAAGFPNVDYFCRLFKKRYHLTPTEYRKKKEADCAYWCNGENPEIILYKKR